VLQAAIQQENLLLVSKRLDLRNQVAPRGCRQSGGNNLDDWIVTTPGGEDGLALHCWITHDFLDLLECQSYFLKLGKYEFEKSYIEFLGWLITPEGVTVDPSKATGLSQWL
jgi:hypothetical protein